MFMKKVIATNRKAFHDYFIEEKLEVGLVLVGTEIKSIRKGSVQFKDSFIHFENNEAFIKDMYIGQYEFGNRYNHDETRVRKLLMHKHEIAKLAKKVKLKGYTVVPLSLYLSEGKAKMEIALALGKALHDKRQVQKEKDAKREIEKAIKQNY
jgi:SsrA-binding protein